jgi:hypothetical protein
MIENTNHVINLSAYTTPVIEENKRREWVEYSDAAGEYDNDYFQYLIDRANNSPTNGSIITGISQMIYGKGLAAMNAFRRADEWARFKTILSNEDLKRVIYDRKCLGMGALQITRDKGKIKSITHFPMQHLRPEIMDDEGVINAWYYHHDWPNIKPSDEPKRITAFGTKETHDANEIYVFSRYVAGFDYFRPVDYKGALPYAVLEEDIADFLINDVKNGFSGTKVVNFNNGLITDEKKRKKTADEIKRKLTGATGQKVVVSFNNSNENSTTVESIPLDNAPDHYQYLSDECFNKLIVGHRVTSPMLLGIRDSGGGLGNNADEIKTATLLMDNLTIKPYQIEFIDGLNEILASDDMSFDLYFKTLEPLEFIDTTNASGDDKLRETGLNEHDEQVDMTDEQGENILNCLEGEAPNTDWELVDEREYNEENESHEAWAARLIRPKKSFLEKLSLSAIKSFITQNANKESKLDRDIYKVRFQYAQKYSSTKSRDFCKKMMARTDRGVMYRKEDIDQASFQGVNQSFGHKGRPYSLLKYKGGVRCGHYWKEQLYRLKQNTDGTFKPDKALSSSKEVDSMPNKPKVDELSKIAPKDMPFEGHHPAWVAKNLTK